tara:strand:- start:2921 stop:3106 length:186 start_codon:yes stop_codon:yes gene_type:complete
MHPDNIDEMIIKTIIGAKCRIKYAEIGALLFILIAYEAVTLQHLGQIYVMAILGNIGRPSD